MQETLRSQRVAHKMDDPSVAARIRQVFPTSIQGDPDFDALNAKFAQTYRQVQSNQPELLFEYLRESLALCLCSMDNRNLEFQEFVTLLDDLVSKIQALIKACDFPDTLWDRIKYIICGAVLTALSIDYIKESMRNYLLSNELDSDQCVRAFSIIAYVGFSKEFREVIISHITSSIDTFLNNEFKNVYNKPALEITVLRTNQILGALPKTLDLPHNIVCDVRDQVAKFRVHHLFDTLKSVDIPVELEPVLPALEDIKSAVCTPEMRKFLVSSFQEQCNRRLLNIGTDTIQIVKMYLVAIKAFSFIDPRGVILDSIIRLVSRYMVSRDDLKSIVVSGLLKDTDSPFYTPLEKPKQPARTAALNFENPYELDWAPDTLDTPSDFVKMRTEEPMFPLLSITEFKDSLVQPLIAAFGQNLLRSSGQDLYDLGLLILDLKQKFGAQHLKEIERMDVMLGDVKTSYDLKRGYPTRLSTQTTPLILSDEYWPTQRPINMNTLPGLEDYCQEYQQYFQQNHPDMKLLWKDGVGTVDVSVELADRELVFKASLLEANVISAFGPNPTTTVKEICDQVGITHELAVEALKFWVFNGIVAVKDGVLRILETKAESDAALKLVEDTELCWEDTGESARLQELQQFYPVIKVMLKERKSLPPSRIHSFLSVAVPGYDKTLQDLDEFLNSKVQQGELVFENDEYRLV